MTKKIIRYLFGIFVTTFGVVIIIKANFGAGAWDAVNYNLKELINTTLGQTSIIVNSIILLIIMLYRKNYKYFLIIFSIVLMGLFIDLWNLVILVNIDTSNLLLQFLFYITGVIFLPLGLVIVISSTLPALIIDELTFVVHDILKPKSYIISRLIIEISPVILAIIIGYIAGIGFGAVSVGTIVLALIIAPIINFYLKLFKIKKT